MNLKTIATFNRSIRTIVDSEPAGWNGAINEEAASFVARLFQRDRAEVNMQILIERAKRREPQEMEF